MNFTDLGISYIWRGFVMGKSRNRKITFIPAVVSPNHKNVAIYCRVSTPYGTQEGSLDNQKIGLSEKVRNNPDGTLVRSYEIFNFLLLPLWKFKSLFIDRHRFSSNL